MVFFVLLQEAYRAQLSEYMTLATISRLANSEDDDYTKFQESLQIASFDPRDILEPSAGETGAIETLRGIL